MTIDKEIKQALMDFPEIQSHLDEFVRTGYKLHEYIFLSQVDLVRKLYGKQVYNRFMHIYRGIKEVNEYE